MTSETSWQQQSSCLCCRKNNGHLFADSMSQTGKTRGDYCYPDTYKASQAEAARYFGSYYLFTDLSLDTSAKGRISSVSQFINHSANSRYYTFLNNMTLKMLSISQKSSTFAVRKAEKARWCSVYTHTSSTRYAVEYRNILNFKI